MNPLPKSRNVAARMGHWSATHRKTAIWGWLAFVVAALAFGNTIGTKNIDPAKSGTGESGRASVIVADEFKQPVAERILVQSKTLTAEDDAFRSTISDVVRRVNAIPAVAKVRSPLDAENHGAISADRHSALVELQLNTTDLNVGVDRVKPVVAAVKAAQQSHPEFVVEEFGDATAEQQLNDAFVKDLEKAGLISLPLTLIILVIAFGALVAAGIPLLLALSAVLATMGLIAIPSHLLPVDKEIGAIILLVGLAVGVDYSLFYLKREREERKSGKSERDALETAAATSGRAVLISGFTVMIAMAGLFLTGDKTFSSFGLAMVIVVAVAMVGSVTVLPAVLAWLGDRVDKVHIPTGRRFRQQKGEGRFWNAVLDRVLKRPVVSVVVAGGLLAALGAVGLTMHLVNPTPDSYPQSIPVMKTYNKMQKAFPGGEIPLTIVVKASDVTSPAMQEAVGNLEWRALLTGDMQEPITINVNASKTVGVISIPVLGDGTDARSERALTALRNDILPPTVGKVPGAEYGVDGFTAQSRDFNDLMKRTAPLVFGFVLLFAFILLLISFRSIVIAIKAIVLNLLSVAAAYGVLVLVFQHGWGKHLLGFDYTGGIVAFLPIFLFVLLFGLSMDYHVFILSRVREAYDSGMSTEEAVSHGIKTTAGTVTSAAIVMVGVFSIFGTLSLIFLKQFGIGLAAAVLIDATIVRAVLLPATMKLLGDWNWYLPTWLEWLPRLDHAEKVPEAPATAAVSPTASLVERRPPACGRPSRVDEGQGIQGKGRRAPRPVTSAYAGSRKLPATWT